MPKELTRCELGGVLEHLRKMTGIGTRFLVILVAVGVTFAALVRDAAGVEYEFSDPGGPLIWDFSGVYGSPLDTTLAQRADGSLVGTGSLFGQVSGIAGSVEVDLVKTIAPYWINFSATHTEYVYNDTFTYTLDLDQSQSALLGNCVRTTVGQEYALFLWTWAPYRNSTIDTTSTAIGQDLPDGVGGHWNLSWDELTLSNGFPVSAFVTLASTNSIEFNVSGTHPTLTKSLLNLESPPNHLEVTTVGPDSQLHSIHGQVAGQMVDYDAPRRTGPLSVGIQGAGRVTPFKNGQLLVFGKDYSARAVPGNGNLFAHWTVNDVEVTNPVLRFSMYSNLLLTASFVTNPFVPAKGGYSGLFYGADAVQHASSGFLSLALASSGSFSGRVLVDGGTYPFSGRFDLGGHSQLIVKRGTKPSLSMWLNLGFDTREITGTVAAPGWSSDLRAEHDLSSGGAFAGRYTIVIPGSDGPPAFVGDSSGTVAVGKSGNIALNYYLSDGTSGTGTTKISEKGAWPLYLPLYGKAGSMLGWLAFTNNIISGDLTWIKPANSTGRLYAMGFTNQTAVIGGAYLQSAATWPARVTSGTLVLEGGDFASPLTVNLGPGNTGTSATRIDLSFSKANGLVKGHLPHPATGLAAPVRGVLLQGQNVVRGYFLGTNQSGSVVLQQ